MFGIQRVVRHNISGHTLRAVLVSVSVNNVLYSIPTVVTLSDEFT